MRRRMTMNRKKEKELVGVYYVTSTSEPTILCGNGSNIPPLSSFVNMVIDGHVLPPTYSYTFTTLGKHVVKFRLKDPTILPAQCFVKRFNLNELYFPTEINRIGYAACNGVGVTYLTLPATIKVIEANSFRQSYLQTFIMEGVIPPTLISDNAFAVTTCKFYVPDTSVEAYKTAPYWSVYSSRIFPISDLVNT